MVPARTPMKMCLATECRKPIFFVLSATGVPMPINCDVDARTKRPTMTEPGIGISHFADCVASKNFRKQKGARS